MEPPCKRQKLEVDGLRKNKSYKRYDKPPYSYVGMTALVIRASPGHKLSLNGILTTLTDMFDFFQGEYQGWRDSVRHNLSHNDCFYKVTEIVNNVRRSKRCEWAVDLQKIPSDAVLRQDSRRSIKCIYYAPTLTEHFGLPPLASVAPGSRLIPVTHVPVRHEEIFQAPAPRQRAPKKSKSFTIDAILGNISRKANTVSETTESLPKMPIFPRTMFDNQTPEKALENLRSLCSSIPYQKIPAHSPLDVSLIDTRSSILGDITNTTTAFNLDYGYYSPPNMKREVTTPVPGPKSNPGDFNFFGAVDLRSSNTSPIMKRELMTPVSGQSSNKVDFNLFNAADLRSPIPVRPHSTPVNPFSPIYPCFSAYSQPPQANPDMPTFPDINTPKLSRFVSTPNRSLSSRPVDWGAVLDQDNADAANLKTEESQLIYSPLNEFQHQSTPYQPELFDIPFLSPPFRLEQDFIIDRSFTENSNLFHQF